MELFVQCVEQDRTAWAGSPVQQQRERRRDGGNRTALANTRARGREHAAFTLVEVAVAMLVIGVLVVALYSLIATNVSMVRLCAENQTATQILTEKLEAVRLYNWDQICSNGFVPTNFTVALSPNNSTSPTYYTGRVSLVEAPITESYKTNLLHVTVTLDWKTGERLQTRSMNSYVAKYGMQSYIVR
jgi:prepilin-type N-terminal cleavage/methylation domain-containing protein